MKNIKKNRLFDEIGNIDEQIILRADINNAASKVRHPAIKWIPVAACLVIAIGVGVRLPKLINQNATISNPNNTTASTITLPLATQPAVVPPPPPLPDSPAGGPPASSPNGMRKIVNYNGFRYAFLNEGETFKLEDLGNPTLSDSLGTITLDIMTTTETESITDIAATFAIGGTLHSISSYDPNFRIAVVFDGNMYICQRVANMDDTAISVSDYFESANLSKITKTVDILDHAGFSVLKSLDAKESLELIEIVKKSTWADFKTEDYEAVANAQSTGKSYFISCKLSDGTDYTFYIVPEMAVALIGDDTYNLPKEFDEKCTTFFSGLTQTPPPLY